MTLLYVLSPLFIGLFSILFIKPRRESQTNILKPFPDVAERGDILLRIPSISIHEIVIQGRMTDSLRNGLWLLPYSVFPNENEKGSNVIIAGHRISYGKVIPPPFFYLNLLEKGDNMYLKRGKDTYRYKVVSVFSTNSNYIDVEKVKRGEDRVTLYTCTPVVNPTHRLIVIGDLVSIE